MSEMDSKKRSEILIFLIVLASFGVGIYFYPQMPVVMASHWNIQGQVDGYLPKFWALFLLPFILLITIFLFLTIPKIDPLRKNILKFEKYYQGFIILIVIFLFYLYLLTIVWNRGFKFDFISAIILPFAILFYFTGVLLEKAKRNYFIGIKTPWTLASDEVWNKTHRLGGKLFKISAFITLSGLLFPQYAFYLVILPVLLFSLFLVVYSYLQFWKSNLIS